MMGHKVRDFRPFTAICLEDLVPDDNFYRHVERSIDLSFVRELAVEFYLSIGRPSVDHSNTFLSLVVQSGNIFQYCENDQGIRVRHNDTYLTSISFIHLVNEVNFSQNTTWT